MVIKLRLGKELVVTATKIHKSTPTPSQPSTQTQCTQTSPTPRKSATFPRNSHFPFLQLLTDLPPQRRTAEELPLPNELVQLRELARRRGPRLSRKSKRKSNQIMKISFRSLPKSFSLQATSEEAETMRKQASPSTRAL
jgi:hypothetical protein